MSIVYKKQKVLEAAFAAYRINGGYVKEFNSDKKKSNKLLVKHHLELYEPLSITDEDRSAVADAEKLMRRYTLLSLGNLSQFERSLYDAYQSDDVRYNQIGILSYFPEFYIKHIRETEFKSYIKTEFANSQHLEKNPSDENLVIIKNMDVRNNDFGISYLHLGNIGKNLVSFYFKNSLAENSCWNISARIKKREQERKTNLPLTRLNYVKVKSKNQ